MIVAILPQLSIVFGSRYPFNTLEELIMNTKSRSFLNNQVHVHFCPLIIQQHIVV